jgi:hypothetical protein
MLAPFRVRSFRYQWPADLLTSWSQEMEILILSWYVLVETNSVLWLTIFGALQYFGTLIAPAFGMAGDRVGHRNVLCAMRAAYTLLALSVMALVFSGALAPVHVFVIATLNGLIRPSDLGMRNALTAASMPAERLITAMGVSRTTSDSARIFGALAGAGLFAWLGMGAAYLVIAAFYAAGLILTFLVRVPRPAVPAGAVRTSPWQQTREGLAYVWHTPCVLAGMWLAYLVNMTAFPITSPGLLPYVARDIYGMDQTGLGTLVASFAFGGLCGSITIGLFGKMIRPGRAMIVAAVTWHLLLLAFVHMPTPMSGRVMLVLAGFTQSLSMVPLAVMLLHVAGERYRGRVMGVRMLAIYGMPVGLVAAGPLVQAIGYVPTATLYCLLGVVLTIAIALRWRADLWPAEAPANQR